MMISSEVSDMAPASTEGVVWGYIGAELLARVKGFEAADKGLAPEGAKWQGTSRRVGVGSQILKALGVGKMRLLSSPKKYHALGGFGVITQKFSRPMRLGQFDDALGRPLGGLGKGRNGGGVRRGHGAYFTV